MSNIDMVILILIMVGIYSVYLEAVKNQKEHAEQLVRAYNKIKGFDLPEDDNDGQN